MNAKEQELLDEIMDWFDFRKVAEVMKHLEWKWLFDGHDGVPEEADIRQAVRKQFTRFINEGRCDKRFVCTTGGFEYVIWKNENGCADGLDLKFVVTDWDTL